MMEIWWLFFIYGTFSTSFAWSDNKQRRFKDDFLFGAATSAYQVEGAWNSDGKGESIWDRYVHQNPQLIADGRNGDVASDSYRIYKRDVEMLRELGVDFYRFSISWPRVLPTGFTNIKNEIGLQYYENLINELLKYNIEPLITLYHYDLPQPLQELGGWANPHSVQWFEDYSRIIFDRFASKVKYWLTLNQPTVCMESYGDGDMAPAVGMKGIADYLCVKNMMMAHAKVYRMYEKEYKNKYQGSVGLALSVNWADPINNLTENVQAAEEFRQFHFGMFMHPIWSKEGDFPPIVKDIVARKSKEQGYATSRLPQLSKHEIKLLKGSADFLGMNHYTTFYVKQGDGTHDTPYNIGDISVEMSYGKDWKASKSPWLKSAPYGLYKACLYINKHYDYPPVIVTENGWSTGRGVGDPDRVEHMQGYLGALLFAIEDGTDVRGFTVWSLMDNVEWVAGTSERFGLYEVDFDSKDKKRTARESALFYKSIIETRVVDEKWEPKGSSIQISERRLKKRKVEL